MHKTHPKSLSGQLQKSPIYPHLRPFMPETNLFLSIGRGRNRGWTPPPRLFCLVVSDSARREDHFQKKNCPKRTFPSNFVKLVSKILYLFLAEKMVVCCCLLLLLLFVAILSDFGLLFFLIEALIELRKMLLRKKIIRCTVWELLNPYIRYPDSADLQRCN